MCKIVSFESGNSFYRMNQAKEFMVIQNDLEKGHWCNAVYFFLSPNDICKYDDADHPYPLVIQNIKPFKCVISYMECFREGVCNDDDIKKLVETIMAKTGITNAPAENEGFITWLGNNGYAFQCYHDDKTMELIIPKNLLMTDDQWQVFSFDIFQEEGNDNI